MKQLLLLSVFFHLGIFGYCQTELIVNGNFRNTNTSWSTSGDFYYDSRFTTCQSCPGYAYLSDATGGAANNLFGYIYQPVSIPANAVSATLSFYTYIGTYDLNAAHDLLRVYFVYGPGSSVYELSPQLSNLDYSSGYVKHTYTLPSSLFGVSSILYFQGSTNGDGLDTKFRVDDVSLKYTAGSTSLQTPVVSVTGTTSSSISLGWSSISGASSYDIYTCSGTYINNTSNLSYTINGLNSGTYYDYKVKAKNASTSSSYSSCAGNTTSTVSTVPSIPTGLTATTTSSSSINLSWNSSPNATTYDVYTCAGSLVTSTSSLSHSVTGLLSNTNYSYKIRANNSSGSSAFTSCQAATTFANSTTPTINSLTFTNVIENHTGIDRDFPLYSNVPTRTDNPVKICADGSTATYIKVNVSNTANIGFEILDESNNPISNDDRDGKLGTPNIFGNNIEVPYTHPQYMDGNGLFRSLTLKVTYNGSYISGISFPIRIYRAPIVFIHGIQLTQSPAATFDGMENYLLQQGMYPATTNYESPLIYKMIYDSRQGYPVNAWIPKQAINNALLQARTSKYSCSKADVITHSMGGVLTRLYLQNNYNLNYKNDIHKFIALNCPNSGTKLASYLYDGAYVGCVIFSFINNGVMCSDGLRDLRVDSWATDHELNDPNKLFSQNKVPTHLITSDLSVASISTDPIAESLIRAVMGYTIFLPMLVFFTNIFTRRDLQVKNTCKGLNLPDTVLLFLFHLSVLWNTFLPMLVFFTNIFPPLQVFPKSNTISKAVSRCYYLQQIRSHI